MVVLSSSQRRSKGHVWQGALMMAVLTYLAGLTVNIGAASIAFTFLPLIGICLWPRGSGAVASILTILVFGFLLDVVSFGPLGLWALVYLTVFAVFRPHLRTKPYDVKQAALRWFSMLIAAIMLSFFLGWFGGQSRPGVLSLMYQALIATVLFLPVYGVRHLLKSLFSDPEDRGL